MAKNPNPESPSASEPEASLTAKPKPPTFDLQQLMEQAQRGDVQALAILEQFKALTRNVQQVGYPDAKLPEDDPLAHTRPVRKRVAAETTPVLSQLGEKEAKAWRDARLKKKGLA